MMQEEHERKTDVARLQSRHYIDVTTDEYRVRK